MISSAVQLDLFLDSRAVVLANDAIEALLAGDASRAREAIGRLQGKEPQHQALAPLLRLLDELLEPAGPVDEAADVAVAAERLEREVAPAAREALGNRAGEFLAQRWAKLAEAGGAQTYDPRLPHAYRASLYLQCERPHAAVDAAAAIPAWETNPDALRWLAVARYCAGQAAQGLQAVMRLALIAPLRLPAVLGQINDELLERNFAAFQARCDWLVDGETSAEWFPPWYLIEHPGADLGIQSGSLPDTPAARAAALVSDLLALERRGHNPALIAARRKLRELAPELFDLYMARRRIGHG
jgi:hypothetical protein